MESERNVPHDEGLPSTVDSIITEPAAEEISTPDADVTDVVTPCSPKSIDIDQHHPSEVEVLENGLVTDQPGQLSPAGHPAEASAKPVNKDTLREEPTQQRQDRAPRREREHKDKDRKTDKKDRSREREKDKDKDRDSKRDRKPRSRSRDPKRKSRSPVRRSTERPHRESDRERNRERERDRERPRERDRDRDRDARITTKYRSRSRERDRGGGGGSSRSSRRSRSPAAPAPRKRSPAPRSPAPRRRSRSPVVPRRRNRRSRDRESESDDGIGGYVPRKRQDTLPLPVVILPPGSGAASSNDPYFLLRNQVPSTDPAEVNRVWQEQQLMSRQLVLQQQAASAAAAASKSQRELYVGNLVPGIVTVAYLTQIFNTALASVFPNSTLPGTEPVVSVNLHTEGRYAFVELRTAEMASASLQLNGTVQICNQFMSVGRPSGYQDPIKANEAANAAAMALLAFQTGDNAALAAAAGLAGVNLAQLGILPGPPGSAFSSSYMPNVNLNPVPVSIALPTGAPPVYSGVQFPQPPNGGGYGSAAAAAAAISAAPRLDGLSYAPTVYLCVNGMVNAEVLADDLEYADVMEDLREECNKHAADSVTLVKVPRPPQPALAVQYMGQGNYGRAYVQFKSPESATLAKDAIHGRLFAGTVVQINYISEDAFGRITNSG